MFIIPDRELFRKPLSARKRGRFSNVYERFYNHKRVFAVRIRAHSILIRRVEMTMSGDFRNRPTPSLFFARLAEAALYTVLIKTMKARMRSQMMQRYRWLSKRSGNVL